MAGDNRYSLRRRNPYHTLRNRAVPVRTPGNKLVAQYIKKRSAGVRCAESGEALPGIKHLNTRDLRHLTKSKRTVSRPYGGVYCAAVVKERIINAFMDEEARAAAAKKALADQKAESAKKKK